MYKCIFQSRQPYAEKFQDWVTEEVLPEIRKTGNYSLIPKSYAETLRLYADEVERRELAEKEKLQEELNDKQGAMGKLGHYYNQFLSWADEFQNSTLEQRKMIAC